MELTVVLDSPQTEGFSRLSIDVYVEEFFPAIIDKETSTTKTPAMVDYRLVWCEVGREDDSLLEFDENEEDTLFSLLCLDDQQALDEIMIEELEYT